MNDLKISRRNLLLGTGVGMAGASFSIPALACTNETSASNNTLRFGIISDVHQDVIHDGERRLRLFLDAMKEEEVDFVLQLGDFCWPHQRNDAFMAAWNEFEGPQYHVIGNHDTDGGYSNEQVVEYYGMSDRFYSFDQAGVHIVVLDGNDRGGTSSGYPRFVAEDQLSWLREDLESTDLPTLVLIHQPLDSSGGVDNREAVRALLEQANQTEGHANVIAVLAGHLHLDYCRLINGIYHLQINSASYNWVGGGHRHNSYSPEIHAQAPYIDHTCPYREPLWSVFTVDLESPSIQIEGRATQWVGPSPKECGANKDPAYCQPRTSSWRFPLATTGDIEDRD